MYDPRANQRFTLRERLLGRTDLENSAACYGSRFARHNRVETERFRRFGYDNLVKRDKLNLHLFWLKDASATDPDPLPPPDEIAAEIVDSLETALEKFRLVAAKLAPVTPQVAADDPAVSAKKKADEESPARRASPRGPARRAGQERRACGTG